MRKIVLSIVACAAMAFTGQAQISIIPKSGMTIANMAFKYNFPTQKPGLGIVEGVAFNLPVGEGKLSLQPEVMYIQKNFRDSYYAEDDFFTADVKQKMIKDLVEIPLLVKYTFGKNKLKWYVNAGPSVGYWISGRTKVNAEGTGILIGENVENFKYNFDNNKDNRFDIGIQAGVGILYKVGIGSIMLDTRYGYGLTNYAKNAESGYISQSRTLAITAGYAFPLGGQ